jgi:excinuclease UvrABC ATPase subunit
MKSENTILDQKIELIQWVSSLEDKNIIEKLLQFRKTETKDWWEDIEDKEKNSILQGIEDAENNKLNPHSSAKKLYEKWL